MIVWLELSEPGAAPRRFRLQREEVRVGAGSRNDVVLRARSAPVRAWTLTVGDGSIAVQHHHPGPDEPRALKHGDVLTLDVADGVVTLRVDDVRDEHALSVTACDLRAPEAAALSGMEPGLVSAVASLAIEAIDLEDPTRFVERLAALMRRVGADGSWTSVSLPDGDRDAWASVITVGAPTSAAAPAAWWGTAPDAVAALHEGRCVVANGETQRVLSIPIAASGDTLGLVVSAPLSGDAIEDAPLWRAMPALRELLSAVARRYPDIASREAVEEENRYYRDRQRRHYLLKDLVSEAPRTRELHQALRATLATQEPVLMTGEAGTGKELLARAIHHLSGRARGLLIAQHCGALDEDALDYELFGHARTGAGAAGASRRGVLELADGGTVFLDEVHLLSARLQMKLLRALSEGEIFRIGEPQARTVDVRVVAATHLDLMALADEGRFRRDLALALTRHVLEVPPLRERAEDLPALADHFVRSFAKRYRKQAERIEPATLAWLGTLPWPGNVRELQTVLERAVLHARPDQVELTRDDFSMG